MQQTRVMFLFLAAAILVTCADARHITPNGGVVGNPASPGHGGGSPHKDDDDDFNSTTRGFLPPGQAKKHDDVNGTRDFQDNLFADFNGTWNFADGNGTWDFANVNSIRCFPPGVAAGLRPDGTSKGLQHGHDKGHDGSTRGSINGQLHGHGVNGTRLSGLGLGHIHDDGVNGTRDFQPGVAAGIRGCPPGLVPGYGDGQLGYPVLTPINGG